MFNSNWHLGPSVSNSDAPGIDADELSVESARDFLNELLKTLPRPPAERCMSPAGGRPGNAFSA